MATTNAAPAKPALAVWRRALAFECVDWSWLDDAIA